jgi:S1-C subfamily serine protease
MAPEIVITHLGGSTLAGREQRFAKECVRIGRRPDNDVAFDAERDRKSSGYHAEFYIEGNRVFVRDVGSQNGTFVNGAKISGPTPVGPQDVIRLGESGPEMRVTLAPPGAADLVSPAGPADLKPLLPRPPGVEPHASGEAALQRAAVAARERSRVRRVVTTGLVAVLLCACVGVLLLWRTSRPERALRRSDAELERAAAAPQWSEIADRYRESIFLLVTEDRALGREAVGTAFAIREDGILATSAHAIKMLEAAPGKLAVQGDPGRVFKVERTAAHPWSAGVLSPDVGLVKVDLEGAKLRPLPLAGDDDLRKVGVGTELGTLGFPGDVRACVSSLDSDHKRVKPATTGIKVGPVGRVTNYRAEPAAAFPEATVYEHAAILQGGTTGSPLFSIDGKVVALDGGGVDENLAFGAGAGRKAERPPNGVAINFAIRVDELRKFWRAQGW